MLLSCCRLRYKMSDVRSGLNPRKASCSQRLSTPMVITFHQWGPSVLIGAYGSDTPVLIDTFATHNGDFSISETFSVNAVNRGKINIPVFSILLFTNVIDTQLVPWDKSGSFSTYLDFIALVYTDRHLFHIFIRRAINNGDRTNGDSNAVFIYW